MTDGDQADTLCEAITNLQDGVASTLIGRAVVKDPGFADATTIFGDEGLITRVLLHRNLSEQFYQDVKSFMDLISWAEIEGRPVPYKMRWSDLYPYLYEKGWCSYDPDFLQLTIMDRRPADL